MAEGQWNVAAPGVDVVRIQTPAIHILRLRGHDDAVLDALDRTLATPLPRQPTHADGKQLRVLALAPGEWMLIGGEIDGAALADAAAGATAHLADVGEGRIAYAVAGPRARDLIAKGCPIDLHPRVFDTGRCAQSALAQVLVVIDQPSAAPVFHIYADASYVGHLDLWFADAVIEFQSQDAE